MATNRKYFGEKRKIQMNDFEKNSIDAYKKRFSFWHNKQIDLLTFSINLLFTLSIAVSGFVIANHDKGFFQDKILCNQYSLTHTVLFIFTLSASIGILGLVARLNDFRLTKDIIKARQRIFELENNIKYEDYQPSDKDNQKLKRDSLIWWAKFLGQVTWSFFYTQLVLFILTIWIIVLNV